MRCEVLFYIIHNAHLIFFLFFKYKVHLNEEVGRKYMAGIGQSEARLP